MKLTIIPIDGAVYKDSQSYSGLDLQTAPSNVHALQWQDGSGWIEFNDGSANEVINDLPIWATDALAAWDVADAAANAAPPVLAPTSATMRQARLALLQIGKLDDVTAAIDAMSEPEKTAAQIEWEYALTVERNSALLQSLAAAIGLSGQDLDELFALAVTL